MLFDKTECLRISGLWYLNQDIVNFRKEYFYFSAEHTIILLKNSLLIFLNEKLFSQVANYFYFWVVSSRYACANITIKEIIFLFSKK